MSTTTAPAYLGRALGDLAKRLERDEQEKRAARRAQREARKAKGS